MAIDNLASFQFGMDAEKKLTRKIVGDVTRKFGLDLLSGIVLMTPVDTGRARGNWQVSILTPIASDTDRADKHGRIVIGDGSSTILGAKDFTLIFIQNNLPYIERLEEGSSKQAPAGMVEVTLNRLLSAFR